VAPRGKQEVPIPIALMKDREVDMIACGCSFNAAILKDSSLVTWGLGECGELGRTVPPARKKDGSYDYNIIEKYYLTPSPPIWACGGNFPVHSVACGDYHKLVVTQGFRVATMGLNNYGQLGQGDIQNRDCLTFITALDQSLVTAVCGGGHHSLCLAENGRMVAFGRGDSGQLGMTDGKPEAGYLENGPVEVLLPEDSGEDDEPMVKVSQISSGTNP